MYNKVKIFIDGVKMARPRKPDKFKKVQLSHTVSLPAKDWVDERSQESGLSRGQVIEMLIRERANYVLTQDSTGLGHEFVKKK